MDISIFGLGYVGSVSAACLATKGHQVIGVDINKTKVAMLNTGKALIIEPGLAELTHHAVANNQLQATDNSKDAILASELSFICVGTPSQKNNRLDLQFVKRVCEDLGHGLREKNDFHTIAVRSTIFPGSMKNLVIPTLEKTSGKKVGSDFAVCINPEFMMEGTAVNDFYHPAKNVVGASEQSVFKLLTELNHSYTDMPTVCLDMEAAELIKYCDNIWHALKVGFANEIGNVCKRLEIDSHAVMEVFCQDTKLNLSPYYLKPGFAFGGSCLPKDLRAFLYESQSLDLELPIISAVLISNKLQIEKGLNMVIEQGNHRVGILGFSFKANTDDLRESPIVELIERLIGKGYELTVYDKNVSAGKLHGTNRDYLLKHIPHISQLMVNNIAEVLATSQTIVIGNKSPEFAFVPDAIRDDQVVIDLVRITEKPSATKNYQGICW